MDVQKAKHNSQTGSKISYFNCKKRKTKFLNQSLNSTVINPRSKKKGAEKHSIIFEESDFHCKTNQDEGGPVKDMAQTKRSERKHNADNDEHLLRYPAALMYSKKPDIILRTLLWKKFYEKFSKFIIKKNQVRRKHQFNL